MRQIVKKLFQRSRLKDYEHILKYALHHGYILTSLINWYENDFYLGKKIMLLRHDVDFCANSAYRIYQIEKGLNVTSSFYFRWKTTNEKVMKQMHENFFETSLHFETLATYCIRHGIYKSQHVTHKILNDCLEILKNEIKMFKDCFWQIKTIS